MRRALSRYERTQRSQRRIRAWRSFGRAATGLWLLVYAANIVVTMLTGRGTLFGGPWSLAILCGLAAAMLGPLAAHARWRRRIEDARDPERLGDVTALLGSPPDNGMPSREQERLLVPLSRMLARLSPTDLVYLDDAGARDLYRWVTPQVGQHYPGTVQAILEAARATRDVRALPALAAYLEALRPWHEPAGRNDPWDEDEGISLSKAVTPSVRALRRLLSEVRAEEERAHGLLRPADAPDEAEALLRPAVGGPDPPPEELLRAADGTTDD